MRLRIGGSRAAWKAMEAISVGWSEEDKDVTLEVPGMAIHLTSAEAIQLGDRLRAMGWDHTSNAEEMGLGPFNRAWVKPSRVNPDPTIPEVSPLALMEAAEAMEEKPYRKGALCPACAGGNHRECWTSREVMGWASKGPTPCDCPVCRSFRDR